MNLLFKLMLRAGISGPSMALNLDLTSTLDSKITFTRAGTRNYITGGVLTALATGTPAFESWGGVNRGLAIEPAFTNLITYSNDFSQAVYEKLGGANTAGDAGTGLAGAFTKFTATATTNSHWIHREYGTSVTSGTRQTLSCFVKAAAGATQYAVRLRMSNRYNTAGPSVCFRIDGTDGEFPVLDTTIATDLTYGIDAMSDGIFRIWISAVWAATGAKEFDISTASNSNAVATFHTAQATDAFQVFGIQFGTTSRPGGYVATVAATASQAAESAIFNDTAWLTTAQGTFVVEHDCWSGPIVGSGANTVLGATVPGKTAIAWSGVTSDTINNGGSAASSTQPTFSGSDVRLLSTSGASNTGHIKSIRFYPTRLSVAEMQALTAPTVASTASPGTLRTVSTKNRLPSIAYTTSGTKLNFAGRFHMPLGNFAVSSLRLDFPNAYPDGTYAFVGPGNSITIDEIYLERVTGVAESVQVFVGGSGSFTVASGAAAAVLSDIILPAAFTGLTEFPANTEFFIRYRARVTSAGHLVVGGRSRYDTTAAFTGRYVPGDTTVSSISGTGAMSFTGGSPTIDDMGYCPILVGIPASGDPKTVFGLGDSQMEGIVSNTHQGPGLYVKKACMALGVPMLEFSKGGISQRHVELYQGWTPYLAYARVLVDAMGTNNLTALLSFSTYWGIAKTTYNYDKIIHSGPFPASGSTDLWATEANQTASRIYPHAIDTAMVELAKYGRINANHAAVAARGVNTAKWAVNGAANYATTEGIHLSVAMDDLTKTEFEPILAAVSVTT